MHLRSVKDNMKIQPLHDRIVVERAAQEVQTSSGIYLPDSAQEKPLQGTVLAIGPGKRLESGEVAPIGVKKGEVVLYGKYSGTEVTVEGKEYVILKSDDILGVLEGKSSSSGKSKSKAGAKA